MSRPEARTAGKDGQQGYRQTASAPVSPKLRPGDLNGNERGSRDRNGRWNQASTHATGTPERHLPRREFQPDASVALVGIRGCGKRSLGFIAATALGRRFITEDHYFQTITGHSRQDYLKLYGSEEFHKQDIQITRQMLEENKTGCVIDCGLGSLTSGLQEYLRAYSISNPVIYILRDMDQIKRLLKLTDRSAKLLESGDPTHRRCSNYEYYNLEDDLAVAQTDQEGQDRGLPSYSFKLRQTQADFSYFVKFVSSMLSTKRASVSPFALDVRVDARLFTHALEIPFSLYDDKKIDLAQLESGGDVVEIRIDKWQNGAVKALSRMVADIRRNLKVPVVVSVAWRSAGLTLDTYLSILKHCLRLAIEFLSIDLDLGQQYIADLLSLKGPTRCIATSVLGVTSSDKSVWLDGTAANELMLASKLKFDLVRLSHVASSRSANEDVSSFLQMLKQQNYQGPAVMAFNTGSLGRTSQVFNQTLTPVTHDIIKPFLVSQKGAPVPQITAQQTMQALFSTFVLDPLDFCIIGGNVTNSLSPAMHNAAYKLLGLSHRYTTLNIKSWDDVDSLAKNPSFGGASVVQPWKVRLASKVAHLSEHARIIGAINTLVPLRSNKDGTVPPLAVQAVQRNRAGPVAAWYGDNTDWIAMTVCVSRSLSPRNVIQPKSTALVVGAGGMARSAIYALIQQGFRNIFVYNRTTKNAETLASHYNQWLATRTVPNNTSTPSANSVGQVTVIRSLDEPWPKDYVMPTVVISCVTHEHLDGNPDANFTMPRAWLGSESGGVVLELAYMTRETPLISQIKQYRQSTGTPWVVEDGVAALFEQALAQFEIMTGRPAPKRCMHEAVSQAIQKRQNFVTDGEEYQTL